METFNIRTTPRQNFNAFVEILRQDIKTYPFYQYSNYPTSKFNGWIELFLNDIEICFTNPDCYFFCSESRHKPYFIAYHINKWDYEHFGIRMAKSIFSFSYPEIEKKVLVDFVNSISTGLINLGVKFVTTRINGDNLALINAHLSNRYEYIETVIWPVLNSLDIIHDVAEPCEVLKNEEELEVVKDIAREHQYKRGHFHCDPNFDVALVNDLYAKWVETSFDSDDDICIIRYDNTIIGYMVCKYDARLEKYLGNKYGRLKSLALNSNYRGQKLGNKLFKGTLQYLIKRGCDYIDSGYITKNHISAKIHSTCGFYSVYEEITLHKWL